jgi:hypothetical protein
MTLPGFTAAVTVRPSTLHHLPQRRSADPLEGIGPAGVYKCGVDCICDPGQCCSEKTFSCGCKACAAVTERAKPLTFLTR